MESTGGAEQSPAVQQQQQLPLELKLLIDVYSVLQLNIDPDYTPLRVLTDVLSYSGTSSEFSDVISTKTSLLNFVITPTEISVVLPSVTIPKAVAPWSVGSAWLAFRLDPQPGKKGGDFGEGQWRTSCGPLGNLARISDVLAKAMLSHFAVSTFHKDYMLVNEMSAPVAVKALKKHGFNVQLEDSENEYWTDIGWFLGDFDD